VLKISRRLEIISECESHFIKIVGQVKIKIHFLR